MVWVSRSNRPSPEHTTLVLRFNRGRGRFTAQAALGAAGGLNLLWLTSKLWQQPFFSFRVFFRSSGNELSFCPRGPSWQSLQKTSLVLSQAFQRVAILFPLWPETFQCPSLTSSVVILAVDSLAEYEPRWSCKVAFSGLCHPQKWYICHNHHCL